MVVFLYSTSEVILFWHSGTLRALKHSPVSGECPVSPLFFFLILQQSHQCLKNSGRWEVDFVRFFCILYKEKAATKNP